MFGDDEDDEPQAPAWRRIGTPAAALLFVSFGAYGLVTLMKSSAPGPRPHIEQHITSIMLPPPPPPPPKPPPPPQKAIEKPKEEQRVAAHVPTPKAPPKIPSPPAPLTAIAGPGTDAYGLKAGQGGGGDLVGGDGTGDGGDAGPYYEAVVKSMVSDAVERDDHLRMAHYRATISFVFDAAGHVAHVSFQNFDGDADVREEVVRALNRMAASENIPANMANGRPWVVRLAAHRPG